MPAATHGMIDPDGPWRPSTSQRNANLTSQYYPSHPAAERVLHCYLPSTPSCCPTPAYNLSECAHLALHQSSGNHVALITKDQPDSHVLKSVLLCSHIQQAYCSGPCMHLPAITRSRWTDKLQQTKQLMQERATYTGHMPGTICTTQWYAHSSSTSNVCLPCMTAKYCCSCCSNATHIHHVCLRPPHRPHPIQ